MLMPLQRYMVARHPLKGMKKTRRERLNRQSCMNVYFSRPRRLSMPWYWRISLLGIVLFFYNSETFVVFHQGNFVDEFDRDWYSELLMPEVDDIVFNIEVVLLIDN